jgi:DMSO reductase family type II enzyme heme b subunit
MTPKLLLTAALFVLFVGNISCAREPEPTPDVVAVMRADLPADPGDAAWRDAPVHLSGLLLQDLVEPRLMEPSTTQVRAQAITNGIDVAFRLEWDDPEGDDLPQAGQFVDAAAVQVPVELTADLPAPQMGETGRSVEITYWRASWQAVVDGRGDDIQDVYPGATVDHYPFEAASLDEGSSEQQEMASRYAPARALGNMMAGPRTSPVEDLVASGPSTLEPGPSTNSAGHGVRTDTGWAVVISRRLPNDVRPGGRGQVAFAVWQGSNDEAGSRKMRTGWVPLTVEGGV